MTKKESDRTLERFVREYEGKTPRSRALHARAARVMPGGNSRTTIFFDPYPFYAVRGEGARIWDADGVERLDFNGNYTSLILGHAPPEAIQDAAALGVSFPAPTEQEIRLAEILTQRVPSMEMGERLRSGVTALLTRTKRAGQVTGVGSLFCLHWTKAKLTGYRSSRPTDPAEPLRVFLGLLNAGVLLSQRGLRCCSAAMTEADVDRFVAALGNVLEREKG